MTAPYTQHELEAMLADLESDLVERKESLRGDNPRKIRQAVCAFANDLPDHQRAGVVFVGADDAGTPMGLEITDELLLQLADVQTDGNIVPPPTLTVDRRVLLGTPVAVGTGVGLAGAGASSRFLESLLHGVAADDPLTFAAAPLVLVAVALVACWLPARQATRVDPIKAMRVE